MLPQQHHLPVISCSQQLKPFKGHGLKVGSSPRAFLVVDATEEIIKPFPTARTIHMLWKEIYGDSRASNLVRTRRDFHLPSTATTH